MTAKPSESHPPDTGQPLGTKPHHSKTPVLFLIALYALWFLLLFWMAASKSGE